MAALLPALLRRGSAKYLSGAKRHGLLPSVSCRRGINNVSNANWSFDFAVTDDALHAEYGLPDVLPSPKDAMVDFYEPLAETIRSSPTKLLDTSPEDSCTLESLRSTACTLQFFADLRQHSEELIEQQQVMEAIVLTTTHWKLQRTLSSSETPQLLLSLIAQRNGWDRAPAFAVLCAGLAGPWAWLPGVLVMNEIIMRRVDKYGALPKAGTAPPSDSKMGPRWDLAKATIKHHVGRMLYDPARVIKLDDTYKVDEAVDMELLRSSILDGTFGEHVTGKFDPWPVAS